MPTLPQILTDLLNAAKAQGMTVADIAAVCGTTRQAVYRWTREGVSPGVDTIQPLADHLGIRLTKPRKR